MRSTAEFALCWAVVLNACADTGVPSSTGSGRGSLSDYASRIEQVRARAPRSMVVVAHPPFIVVGQGSHARVTGTTNRLIGGTVALLKQDFFERDPEVTEVWLLDDAQSYAAITRRLFGREPQTPFGFYVAARQLMVMNLGTGGGTLIHELVHPFMAASFPECPPWFNEGLGALFERSEIRDGHLVGLINWRLPPLQEDLRLGTAVDLEQLMRMDDLQFYADGAHYGPARYLLYYLQEHGLLHRYYAELRRRADQDASGVEALRSVLGAGELAPFEAQWKSWVLALGTAGGPSR